MRKTFVVLPVIVSMILGFSGNVYATSGESSEVASSVSSIYLKGSGQMISWQASSLSKNGFKVVWSKNRNPEYPTRDGDKYHYFSESNKTSDTLEAFNGDGVYYVRVCEYLGGKCGTYSNQVELTLSGKTYKEESRTDKKPEVKYNSGDYEKIPNIDSIRYYTNIKKEGDALYGVKIDNILQKKNLEKITRIEDIKYFKNIEKIGDSLYGVRIENTRKTAIENKIKNLNEQMKKIQAQIEDLQKELSIIE